MVVRKETDADRRYKKMMSKKLDIVEAIMIASPKEGGAVSNRAKYPEVAQFVDEVRKYFPGANVASIKPIEGKENDNG